MSDKKNENIAIKSELIYMRLSNLPWSACHQEVHKFFEGVAIPQGGVSIHRRDAYVAFLNIHDLNEALKKNGNSIQGNTIYLSILESPDFQNLMHQNIRRVLDFTPKLTLNRCSSRRIRPTCKTNIAKDMFSVFNPVENEVVEHSLSGREFSNPSLTRKAKRKIKPTILEELTKFRNSFYEEYDYRDQCSKKLKLDETHEMVSLFAI